jgi:hypothetical protein
MPDPITPHTLAEQLSGLASRLASIPGWNPPPDAITTAACQKWSQTAYDLAYNAVLLDFEAEDAAYAKAVKSLSTQIAAIDAADKKISSIAATINTTAQVLSYAEVAIKEVGAAGL